MENESDYAVQRLTLVYKPNRLGGGVDKYYSHGIVSVKEVKVSRLPEEYVTESWEMWL